MKMAKPSIGGDAPPGEELTEFKSLVTVSDASVVKRASLRLKIAEYINMYLALVGIICGGIEHEISVKYGVASEKEIRILLLSINVFVTVIQCKRLFSH
jgi:hypothetical protein